MYIRTRTGNVLYDVMLNVKWTAKIDNGLKYYDFDGDYAGLVICENNFKSQGDNLIDVLEDNDMITYKGEEEFGFTRLYGAYDNFYLESNNSQLQVDLISNVITHEQYMKLAQKVI
jgi:hypothetical protein